MEAPRELDPTLPFTRADGLAAGITPAVLRGPRYRKLGRGVYVDAAVPLTPLLVARTALLAYGARAHASHATAARIHGLPIATLSDEHVTVIDQAQRRAGAGALVHVDRNAEVVTIDGVRVSSRRQTFLDLAGTSTWSTSSSSAMPWSAPERVRPRSSSRSAPGPSTDQHAPPHELHTW